MKRNYRTIKATIGLLSVIALNAGAQALSGSYTINAGGIASATTYTSFTSFAAALNTGTVTGAITVNVAAGSGPYNEQITFNQATGISATNKVTINGNGNTLAFNSSNSAAPWTMQLNGADYMTFDNLNITGQGSTYAMVVVLTNAANYNTFSNSTYSAPVNGTSSYQCPFQITSSNTSPTSGGIDAGNYNTVKTCTMANGYYGCVMYGLTGSPYQQGNQLLNSLVTDFYYYGVYYYYGKNFTISNNIIERPTRTTSSTVYCMYGAYSQGCLIDGNKIWKIFESQQNASTYCYAMYIYYNPIAANPLRGTVRNNIITGIKNNSYVYGIYAYNANSDIYNNTIDMDNVNATTGGIYALTPYTTGAPSYSNTAYNNIISIQRGASSGTKYGMYLAGYTSGFSLDKNDIYLNNSAGTNYYGQSATTMAAYQATGFDVNSFSVSPMFANQANYDLHPTNPAINNAAIPMGLIFDQSGAIRNPTTPDIGALEFLTPNCAGLPNSTAVSSVTYAVCPGSSNLLGLSNLQTDLGITWQWQMSTTSSIGPWTNIPGATGPNYTTPPATGNVYYSAAVTCANGNGSIQATSTQLILAGTTVNTIPYVENFENTSFPGQLPNCSWSTPSGSTAVQTYTGAANNFRTARSGTKFAAFNGQITSTNYVYTNGLQLSPGVTYSAAMHYITDNTGNLNWSNLAMSIGTAQASAGLAPIVANNGPVVAPQYAPLSGTFTVANPGVYYLAISALSNGNSYYLTFDDVSVTAPCSLNSPSLAVSGVTAVCSGQPVNLSASGANTYMWTLANSSFTSNTAGLTNVPNVIGTANYVVAGTNTLTNCTSTLSKPVSVIPSPIVSAYMSEVNNAVCPGAVAILHAAGTASSYSWSTTGLAGANATIMPAANTIYTVVGSNATNCLSTATIAVTLQQAPAISGSPSRSIICVGESVTLSGSGADEYTWISNSVVLLGNIVIASPIVPTNFNLVGKDATTGCTSTVVVSVNVNACTGISTVSADNSNVNVYPNPANSDLTIELNNNSVKTISVTDLTGRVLASNTTSDSLINFNVSSLSNGVYFVKIQSNEKVNVVKFVKQ